MKNYIILAILVVFAGCAVDASPQVLPRVIQPGDALTLSWTDGVSANTRAALAVSTTPVVCGHLISHPCPFITFTKVLGIEGVSAVFGSATGGSDNNGVPAENHLPWTEPFVLDGYDMILDSRGDDGGLRLDVRLSPFQGGYAGDFDYLLFNIPGYTRFHVMLSFEVAQDKP